MYSTACVPLAWHTIKVLIQSQFNAPTVQGLSLGPRLYFWDLAWQQRHCLGSFSGLTRSKGVSCLYPFRLLRLGVGGLFQPFQHRCCCWFCTGFLRINKPCLSFLHGYIVLCNVIGLRHAAYNACVDASIAVPGRWENAARQGWGDLAQWHIALVTLRQAFSPSNRLA